MGRGSGSGPVTSERATAAAGVEVKEGTVVSKSNASASSQPVAAMKKGVRSAAPEAGDVTREPP